MLASLQKQRDERDCLGCEALTATGRVWIESVEKYEVWQAYLENDFPTGISSLFTSITSQHDDVLMFCITCQVLTDTSGWNYSSDRCTLHDVLLVFFLLAISFWKRTKTTWLWHTESTNYIALWGGPLTHCGNIWVRPFIYCLRTMIRYNVVSVGHRSYNKHGVI